MLCKSYRVTGATRDSFNGKYEISTLSAIGDSEKDVYRKKGGNKVIFWRHENEWAIGLLKSLTSGEDYYRGMVFNNI